MKAINRPHWTTILCHSFYAMAAGWLCQAMILLVCIILCRSFPVVECLTHLFWLASLIIAGVWGVFYVPVYFVHYSDERYFSRRWRFTVRGALIALVMPFIGIPLGRLLFTMPDYFATGWVYLITPVLALACGGVAAEVGYQLRRRQYPHHGPIKLLH